MSNRMKVKKTHKLDDKFIKQQYYDLEAELIILLI